MCSSDLYDPSDLIFRAIRDLLDAGKISADTFRFLWIGDIPKWLARVVTRLRLDDVFQSTGQIPRDEAARHLRRVSVLLVRIVRPCLSTKLFEGLAAGVPILATIEPGEAETLVRRYSRRFYIVRPSDAEGVQAALLDAYHRWETGEVQQRADDGYLRTFNKGALTDAFATALDEVAGEHRRGAVPSLMLEHDGTV